MAQPNRGVVFAVARWLRSYLVLVVLLALVARVAWRALFGVIVPNPEFPPNNYDVVRDMVQLEWSRSSDQAKTHLEVSAGDPSFGGSLAVDEDVSGTTYTLSPLEPGTVYYWRVAEGEKVSTTSFFRTAADVVEY